MLRAATLKPRWLSRGSLIAAVQTDRCTILPTGLSFVVVTMISIAYSEFVAPLRKQLLEARLLPGSY